MQTVWRHPVWLSSSEPCLTHSPDSIVRFICSQVTFSRAKFGGRPCSTRRDARTGRLRCVHDSKLTNSTTGIAELWISEHPWPGVQIPRDCLCSKISEPVVLTALTSSVVEVNFTVTLMNITQDFNHFHFEGEYQFVSISSSEDVENCLKYKKQRRLRGSSGVIELRSPNLRKVDDINEIFAERLSLSGTTEAPATDCGGHPWLVEPEDNTNNFLYVKIKGYELPPSKWQQDSFQCGTTNRIIVYTGISTRDPKVVCPLEGRPSGSHRIVEVFSDGWNSSTSLSILNPKTRSFVVEFLEQEPGNYWVSWLEVSKRPLLTATSSFVMSSSTIDCPYRWDQKLDFLNNVNGSVHPCFKTIIQWKIAHFVPRCPELNACINSQLWCDGIKHCPTGYDEEESNCAFQFGVPVLYVAIGGGALIILTMLIATTACFKCRQTRRNKRKKNSASSRNGTASRYPVTNPEDLYMDGKDSLCWQNVVALETTVWHHTFALRQIQRYDGDLWTSAPPPAELPPNHIDLERRAL